MTTPNVALLNQTLAYIEAHPQEWDQTTWHCGTTACFAGHAALLDGAEWAPANVPIGELVLARDDDPDLNVLVLDGTPSVFVDDRAQRILGLTEYQATELFSGCNSLDDLRTLVAEFTSEAS